MDRYSSDDGLRDAPHLADAAQQTPGLRMRDDARPAPPQRWRKRKRITDDELLHRRKAAKAALRR